jgi:hypothetical protein
MKHYSVNLFDLIIEKFKSEKGYIVVAPCDSDQCAQIFHFGTKEEFEKNFEMDKHPYYPGNKLVPKNRDGKDGPNDFMIDNYYFYLGYSELYLIINGDITR